MNIQEVGIKFSELIGQKMVEFGRIEEYPEYVRLFSTCVLEVFGVKWSAANIQVEDFFLLKIEDPILGYLIVGPDSFMWCDKKCEDSINPDEVFIHLFKHYNGIDVQIDENRNVSFFKDGKPIKTNGGKISLGSLPK